MKYLIEWEEPKFDLMRPIAFDTETAIPRGSVSRKKGLALYGDTRLMQFAQDGKCYIYDCYHINIEIIKTFFREVHLYAHNAIYDFSCPDLQGWLPRELDCTLDMLKHSNPEMNKEPKFSIHYLQTYQVRFRQILS